MHTLINTHAMKKCAFCKYWYDPTNSGILPKSSIIGLWEIKDTNQKCICLNKNIPMPANGFCNDYECKI